MRNVELSRNRGSIDQPDIIQNSCCQLTTRDVNDPVAEEGLDQFRPQLILGVPVSQPAVTSFSPRVQLAWIT